jgi:regulator of replication initiation timing
MVKQFSYSQALLAIAIALLALSLFKFTMHVPAIISAIEKTTKTVDLVSPKVDDIVNEVALVRVEVSKVRKLVAQQTPVILSQVEASLPVVQQVVVESEYYSRQLPALLDQIANIEQQVEKLQTSMPAILKRVDAVVKTTNNTTEEVARWRPHSSRYLEEIELSREYIPDYLSRIENTVIDAKTIGSEASSGLVSGFFKGVISLPFEVVSGLTGIVDADSRSAKYLTAQDVALMQEKVVALLNDSNQTKAAWQNVKSGNRGTIIKGKKTTRNKQQCLMVTFNNHFGNDKETLKELMCINDKGLWKVS